MHTLPNLPPAIAAEVFATLCDTLPPPTIDTPETRAARHDTAMAAVAALHPTDAHQALLAARSVAADYQAMHCLRLAEQPGQDFKIARQCRAQSNAMMRNAASAVHALRGIQAKWEKAEAEMHPVAMQRAGYWFRDVSVPAPEGSAEPPPFEQRTEAEQYAAIYPERAALIRAHGGLPPGDRIPPPEPHIVKELVTSNSPVLRALDRRPPVAAAA
jgi:hypothetical protein